MSKLLEVEHIGGDFSGGFVNELRGRYSFAKRIFSVQFLQGESVSILSEHNQ